MKPEDVKTAADLVQLQQEKLRERQFPLVTITAPTVENKVADLAQKIAGMAQRDNGVAEAREKERKAKEEASIRDKIATLRYSWCAPERCVEFHEGGTIDLQALNPWNKMLATIKGRLGMGFIVAMIGARWTGKTQFATELMFEATDAQNSALYTTTLRFLMEVRATYRKDSKESELGVLERFRRPAFLVMDEFGKRGQTDWEHNILFELLDSRHQDMSDTLIISNETRPQFEEAAGPSISRRIAQTGGLIDTTTWPRFEHTQK